MAGQKGEKLAGLQIARALAAISIAYFHSWHVTMPFPPGTDHPIPFLKQYGWLAVDFFFAISGFVICFIATKPTFNPFTFLIRRGFRLYPLLFATSFLYLWLTDYTGRAAQQTYEFFKYSLTLLPTEGFPFYDIAWSLQHEMAFYVLAAITIPLFGIELLVAVLIGGSLADLTLSLPWYLSQYFSYYPNFLIGIAAFLLRDRLRQFGFVKPLMASLALFALFLGPLHLQRIYLSAPLFLMLVAFINMRVPAGSKWGQAGILLGDASYSIYLIHPLVWLYIYVSLQPPLPPIWAQEPIRYAGLLLVCAYAIASWTLFESPMIWIGNKVANLSAWFANRLKSALKPAPDVAAPPQL